MFFCSHIHKNWEIIANSTEYFTFNSQEDHMDVTSLMIQILTGIGGMIALGITIILTMRNLFKDLRTEFKTDISELRTEFKEDIGNLKTEISELRTEFKSDINELRTEIKADIQELRLDIKAESGDRASEISELRHEFHDLRSDIKEDLKIMRSEFREDYRDLRSRLDSLTDHLALHGLAKATI
jgi:hypothetical protein